MEKNEFIDSEDELYEATEKQLIDMEKVPYHTVKYGNVFMTNNKRSMDSELIKNVPDGVRF